MALVLALTGAAAVRVWDSVVPIGEVSGGASVAYGPPLIVQADVPGNALALTFTRRPSQELRE